MGKVGLVVRLGEQIGLALGCLADVEIDEALQMASKHGYQAVEIAGDEAYADLGFRGLWPWEERIWNFVQPMLEPFQFKAYHAPFDGLNFLTLNPVSRTNTMDQIRAAIDTAAEMGLSPVIVHPGQAREDMDERVVDLLMSTFLQELAAYAEEKEVKVALETCEFFENLNNLQHYMAKVDSPYLGICLDLNPAMVEANGLDSDSLNDFICSVSSKMFHCRLHGMVSEQAQGRLNYEEAVKTLVERDYQGAVIFQIVTDAIDNINETRNVIYKVG